MKCLRRWLSALLCCVLLLGVSSVGVNAAESGSYQVYQYHQYPGTISGSGLTFIPNNNDVEKIQTEINAVSSGTTYTSIYRVTNVNKDILFEGGKTAKVRFNNVYFSLLLTDISSPQSSVQTPIKYTYINKPTSVYCNVTFDDGSTKTYYDEVTYTQKDKALNFTFEFLPSKDVSQITFFAKCNVTYTMDSLADYVTVTLYSGEFDGDDKFQFTADIDSGVTGFLSGITDWLIKIPQTVWDFFSKILGNIFSYVEFIYAEVTKVAGSIWSYFDEPLNLIFLKIGAVLDGVGNLPQWVWDKFKSAFNTIYEWFGDLSDILSGVWNEIILLPTYVWDMFETGLKKLFVPTEEDIAGFKVEIEELMHTRLGAIYQVSEILTEDWDSVLKARATNTIEMPEVTIDLPGKAEFTFGGYDVKIVPDKFGFLADSCKIITGVLFTILFTNMLRKKYDEVIH